MNNKPNTLKEKMTFTRKMSTFIEYLQKGGEVEIDGRIYVWLDNHITSEVQNPDGTTTCYEIDGLAIKTTSKNMSTGEEKPYYMGQSDMPIAQFFELIENLTEENLLDITSSLTLMGIHERRQANQA